ncbi:MAG: hypothetical protein ACD_63C00032G0001 [uncultured bacterium]|nr:MAG: hypothetical protein ACD_63C00032G0001 [uncultured bacterium]
MVVKELKKWLKGTYLGFYYYFVRNVRKESYANFGEDLVIKDIIDQIFHKKVCVDIGAGNGFEMSNTYLFFLNGYRGLALEVDSGDFRYLSSLYCRNCGNVSLAKLYITPENVVDVLKTYNIPKDFGILSLDIDGYDYFVLEKIFGKFRPTLVCAEINEKVPPPLKFAVKWERNYVWAEDHFYGQSLSKLYDLCEKFDYDLVKLNYNNAILISKEKNTKFKSLNPSEAYGRGYKFQKDRKEKFPWNEDMEKLLSMNSKDAIDFINKKFKKYRGKYILGV